MEKERKKRSRWRWVWRIILTAVVVVVAAGAIPFLFTTALARWAVGRSAYGVFSPEVSSATLSMRGELVIRNLVLHEPAPHGERVLLKAETVRGRFGWTEVMGGTLRDVRAEGVEVFARPGDEEAVTLMELAPPPPRIAQKAAATQGVSSSAASAKPFWLDDLYCSGTLHVESFEGFQLGETDYPFELMIRMRADRMKPTRELELSVGATAETGRIAGKVVVEPTVEGDRVTISEISARGVRGRLAEVFAKSVLAKWPKTFQQEMEVRVGSVVVSGVIERTAQETTGHGRVEMHGLEVTAKEGAAEKFELKGLDVSGDVAGPLGRAFLTEGAVDGGKIAVESLAYGGNKVERFETPWTIGKGVLDAPGLRWGFAKGEFAGSGRYSLAGNRLESVKVGVKHLDQEEVARNIAPEKLNAEGAISGEIELGTNEKGVIVGAIKMASDGPGRLQIKDQETSEQLAQKLEVGAGVLPANFSTIVVQQLKDYPYKTGKIEVSAPDGVPVVRLDYEREGVKPGEPGYGVKAVIGGQEVVANYTVQLPGLTIALRGKTIPELLALAAGFGEEITGEGKGK